jgi:hypothetical protein
MFIILNKTISLIHMLFVETGHDSCSHPTLALTLTLKIVLVGLQMFSVLVAFIIDTFIPRLLNVDGCIFILRNVFHFFMTSFVFIAYSLVEFYALHELLIRGKKVCKHEASNKNVLNY